MTTSEQLFRGIYDDLYDQVHAFCARRVGYDDADDVTADVFAAIWRRIEDVDMRQKRAWTFAVARRVVLNHWRAGGRRRRLRAKVGGVGVEAPEQPETVVVRRDQDAAVLEALESLPAKDREVLMLSAWDDLSAPEISAVLNISAEAVRQRISRARRRLERRVTSSHPELVSEFQGEAGIA